MNRQRVIKLAAGLLGAVAVTAALMTFTPWLSVADGQQGPPPGGPMGRFGGPGRGGPGGPMGPFGMGIPVGDLSDAQREQMKAIRDRHADEMKPMMDRYDAAQKALTEAVETTPVDQNQLRLAANDLGAAESDLAFARGLVEAEVLSVLTTDQRSQMDARRKQMEERRSQMQERMRGRGNGRQ